MLLSTGKSYRCNEHLAIRHMSRPWWISTTPGPLKQIFTSSQVNVCNTVLHEWDICISFNSIRKYRKANLADPLWFMIDYYRPPLAVEEHCYKIQIVKSGNGRLKHINTVTVTDKNVGGWHNTTDKYYAGHCNCNCISHLYGTHASFSNRTQYKIKTISLFSNI